MKILFLFFILGKCFKYWVVGFLFHRNTSESIYTSHTIHISGHGFNRILHFIIIHIRAYTIQPGLFYIGIGDHIADSCLQQGHIKICLLSRLNHRNIEHTLRLYICDHTSAGLCFINGQFGYIRHIGFSDVFFEKNRLVTNSNRREKRESPHRIICGIWGQLRAWIHFLIHLKFTL